MAYNARKVVKHTTETKKKTEAKRQEILDRMKQNIEAINTKATVLEYLLK